jgi:hypothetical protein
MTANCTAFYRLLQDITGYYSLLQAVAMPPRPSQLYFAPHAVGRITVLEAEFLQHGQATGKSPEPAGWKACAT